MKTLPHALLHIPVGLSLPGDGLGSFLPYEEASDSAVSHAYAAVDSSVRVETLRRALAGGAMRIALKGCRMGADLQHLATLLSVAEAEEGLTEGGIPILAMTDGILPAPASPQSFAGKSGRLIALVWDQRGLAHKLGSNHALTESGEWTAAFAAARAAVLLTAAAAGVQAYDSASDLAGDAFTTDCERSRNEGFFGRLATDRAQASVIETTYERRAPSDGD